METSVASVVRQASTELPPGSMVLGVTVVEAVGAGHVGDAGGGGGGGTAFLWQPATRVRVATAMSDAKYLCCGLFTMFSLRSSFPKALPNQGRMYSNWTTRPSYFQLQLGIEFPPLWVRRCCSVPSESMVHISAPPRSRRGNPLGAQWETKRGNPAAPRHA